MRLTDLVLGDYMVAAPPHADQRVTVTRVVMRDHWGQPSVYFTEHDGRPSVMGANEFCRRASPCSPSPPARAGEA